MAERNGKRIGGVVGTGDIGKAQMRRNAPLHLSLVRTAVSP